MFTVQHSMRVCVCINKQTNDTIVIETNTNKNKNEVRKDILANVITSERFIVIIVYTWKEVCYSISFASPAHCIRNELFLKQKIFIWNEGANELITKTIINRIPFFSSLSSKEKLSTRVFLSLTLSVSHSLV